MEIHSKYMSLALQEAEKCAQSQDVPIGAVITYQNEVIAKAYNQVEKMKSPLAHAEILAINQAVKVVGHKHLLGCDMYVTLEPCSMCAGAITLARMRRIFFGAYDIKTGAVESLYSIPTDSRLNHTCEVYGGIMMDECSSILRNFFKNLRNEKNAKD